MKKYIIITSLVIGALAYGQINVYSSPQSTIDKENPFLDASSYSDNGFKNHEGKGLYFPTTDLRQWEFKLDAVDPVKFSNYFDGMIVYNTGEGNATTNASVGGIRKNLKRGFYYFKNPNQTYPNGNVENGEWVRIANADDIVDMAPQNIYNTDGTLDKNRTLNTAGYNLSFTGDGKVGIGALPNNTLDKAKLQVEGLIRSNNIRKAGNELTEEEAKAAKEVFVDTNGIFRVKEADKLVSDNVYTSTPTCKFVVDNASKLFWGDNFGVTKENIQPVVTEKILQYYEKYALKTNQQKAYEPLIEYFKKRQDKGCESRFDLKRYRDVIERTIYCKQKKNPMIFKFDVKRFNNYGENIDITIKNKGYNTYSTGNTPFFNMDVSSILDGDGAPRPICPPIDVQEPAICTLIETIPGLY